jgi:hypothetical protein
MTRRKQRSYGRRGLFEFAIDGDVAEVPDNPLLRRCPSCNAPIGQRCTRPARGGRRDLSGYHDARKAPSESITPGDPHAPSA